MYRLLTGRVPFPGTKGLFGMAQRIGTRPEPLSALRPDLPASVVAVVEKLMESRPEDRYPDADAGGRSVASPGRGGRRRPSRRAGGCASTFPRPRRVAPFRGHVFADPVANPVDVPGRRRPARPRVILGIHGWFAWSAATSDRESWAITDPAGSPRGARARGRAIGRPCRGYRMARRGSAQAMISCTTLARSSPASVRP